MFWARRGLNIDPAASEAAIAAGRLAQAGWPGPLAPSGTGLAR